MAHASGCCPPLILLPRKRSCPEAVLCSHGNGPECLDDGPCSGRVDGYPTTIQRKLKKLDQPGTFMDKETHECFRVTPDQILERLFPKLPSKPMRVKGAIYEVTTGVHTKWNGRDTMRLCRDCVAKQANYPDEDGKSHRLCAGCADKVGTKTVQHPCRDCPKDDKKQASYPDEDGKSYRLCAGCADKVGTKTVQHRCRDCPKDDKKQAHYPDEDGKPCRLCAGCADKVGTKTVRHPCRDCPKDDKKQANYPDEDGKPCRLCAGCAFNAGLKPQATSGASMVACRCWHRLEKVSKAKLTNHVCCIDPTKWTGEEKKGLIPGRAFKPDAYIEPNLPIHLEGETSGPKGAVYLFHGNEWHGYPEGHPKYDEVNYCGDSYKERYHKTLVQEEMYKMEGYRVFVVWKHEYDASEKVKCPVHIQEVVREV